MTLASLHQPNFLPWTRLVDKILSSDIWIVYDSAQYTKTEFHSRQLVKGRNGPVWLSTPVVTANRPRFQTLSEVELSDHTDWRSAHLRLLREHYRRTPYWPEVLAVLEPSYSRHHRLLVDFSLDLTQALLQYLGSSTQVIRATSLPHCGDTTDRLIQLNRAVGADEHLTSTWGSGRVRIDWPRVAAAGISVREQHFQHPRYPQAHGDFVEGLSVLDLLCNCGPASAQLLAQHRLNRLVLSAQQWAAELHG